MELDVISTSVTPGMTATPKPLLKAITLPPRSVEPPPWKITPPNLRWAEA